MMEYNGDMVHAVRPWDGPYTALFSDKRYIRRTDGEQAEIEACLCCPFYECQSRSQHCKTYRAAYIARAK